MSRRYSASERSNKAKAKRDLAMERGEFRYPSALREAPAGATSFPVKAADPQTDQMVADFLANRKANRL